MKLLINTTSMTPIYEQLVTQIQEQIVSSQLPPNEKLPSVRNVAREYKISALTVKKAYDVLESQGLIKTIPGKGSYVMAAPDNFIKEEQQKEVEAMFEQAIIQGRRAGLSNNELQELFQLLLEDYPS